MGTLSTLGNMVSTIGSFFKGNASTAVSRTFQSKMSDTVSAKDFGAKGDGTTDDSIAIQAAIDYVAGLNGGTVVFPHGTYVCNVILKSGVTLKSDAMMYQATFNGFSHVTLKQSVAGFIVDTPSTLTSGMAIHGINFLGLGASVSGGGVRFQNTKWSAIRSCCFNNHADQAMVHTAGFGVVFEDILTVNTLLNRTRTQISGCLESYGTDNFINRCELNPSLTAIQDSTHMYICGLVLGGANSFVNNVVGEFSERGIYVAPVNGTGHRIVAVRGDSNFGYGIYNDGSAQFIGCFAYHNSTGNPGNYSGFYASTTSSTSKYIGCQSDGISGTNIKYGFEDPSAYSDPNSKNDYVACTSLYNQSGVFSLQSTSGAGIVYGSKSTVPANGTTNPSVSGVTVVNLSSYTSATTISTFINPAGGQTIRVLGNSNVTLANGSGIITTTGSNLALADNTMYTLTFIAGFWRM